MTAPTPVFRAPPALHLPAQFTRHKQLDSRRFLPARCALELHQQGIWPLPRPDGHTPASLLISCFDAAFGEAFPAQVTVHLSAQERSQGAAGETHIELLVSVIPASDPPAQLGAFKARLDQIHPELFGALMQELRLELSPYAPIFTAYDALNVADFLHFGESFWDDVYTTYEEAHPGEEATDIPEATLLKFWVANGGQTPDTLYKALPKSLYTGRRGALRWLGRKEAKAIPGVIPLTELLRQLRTLPRDRLNERHFEEYWCLEPPLGGRVIQTSADGYDLVQVHYDELSEFFEEATEYAPLHRLVLRTPEDALSLREYLRDLRWITPQVALAFAAAEMA